MSINFKIYLKEESKTKHMWFPLDISTTKTILIKEDNGQIKSNKSSRPGIIYSNGHIHTHQPIILCLFSFTNSEI